MKYRSVVIIGSLAVLSTIIMIFALNFSKEHSEKYNPPEFEENVLINIDNIPDNVGWEEINYEGMEYSFGLCNEILFEENIAKIYFSNSKSNDVWLKIRVYDMSNNMIFESGIIKPDEYIDLIKLNKKMNDNDKIKIKIMSYEPNTYYSRGEIILNTSVKNGGK